MMKTRRLEVHYYVPENFFLQGKFFVGRLWNFPEGVDQEKISEIHMEVEGLYIRELQRKCRMEFDWILQTGERM